MQVFTTANRHRIEVLVVAAALADCEPAGIRCSAVPAGAEDVAGLVELVGVVGPAVRLAAAVEAECH